jgi:hypothetical protein
LSFLVAQFWLIALTKLDYTKLVLNIPVPEAIAALGQEILDSIDFDTGGIFRHRYDRLRDSIDFDTGGSFGRFYNRLRDSIDFDTGGSFGRFYNRLLGPIDFDTGGSFGRQYDRLLRRPRVDDAAKL